MWASEPRARFSRYSLQATSREIFNIWPTHQSIDGLTHWMVAGSWLNKCKWMKTAFDDAFWRMGNWSQWKYSIGIQMSPSTKMNGVFDNFLERNRKWCSPRHFVERQMAIDDNFRRKKWIELVLSSSIHCRIFRERRWLSFWKSFKIAGFKRIFSLKIYKWNKFIQWLYFWVKFKRASVLVPVAMRPSHFALHQ